MLQIEYVFLAYASATFMLIGLTTIIVRRDKSLRRLLNRVPSHDS